MAFAAIFVPNFKVQAVVRCEPELVIRPLALIDGPAPTYPVIAVNRLAEHLGVALGMTKAAVGQFPGVEIRPRGKFKRSLRMQRCWMWRGLSLRVSKTLLLTLC